MPATAESVLSTRQDELMAWIRKKHGVAHTSDARAAGFSAYEIASAVNAARLTRVRRSWLVTPECDERTSGRRVGGRAGDLRERRGIARTLGTAPRAGR